MMTKFRTPLFSALLLTASYFATADYDLTCQPPSRYIRVLYAQDMSPDMEDITSDLITPGGGIAVFDDWLATTFDSGAYRGILGFTNKKAVGTPDDVCAGTYQDLGDGSVLPGYNLLPSDIGANTLQRSVYDVLYRASEYNWDFPSAAGRRTIVLQAGRLPQEFADLPDFNGSLDCETYNYPSIVEVTAALSAKNIQLIIVARSDNRAAYQSLFPDAVVIVATSDADLYMSRMHQAFDNLYCNVPIVEQGSTSTLPPICESQAILQLLHIQDMSHSYGNDFQNMKDKFPELFALLGPKFFSKAYGLTSFVDKPVAPYGYPGDYCYQEDFNFADDTEGFKTALDSLKNLSGRDWKESQYSAIYDAVKSQSLGWIFDDKVGDRVVVRVMVIATDAGPHEGSFNALNSAVTPCGERDYPDGASLGAVLEQDGFFPIFVVTSDIKPYWDNKVAGKLTNAQVLELKDDPQAIFEEIEKAVENACLEATRRVASIETASS